MRFGAIPSHWSLKSHNSQHANAKFRVVQTAFAHSSIVLWPIRANETRVMAELTACSHNSLYVTDTKPNRSAVK